MAAEILAFRPKPLPAPVVTAGAAALDFQDWVAELERWQEVAGSWGWIITTDPCEDGVRFFVCHTAVDQLPIFILELAFDGWERISRSGEMAVFPSLSLALAAICPVGS